MIDPDDGTTTFRAITEQSADQDRHERSLQQQATADRARHNLALAMRDKIAATGNLQFEELLLAEVRLLPRANSIQLQ
ncbi:hypothetical protein PG990_014512 [Apiospora arundinis]